jgi:hypothetical protein
MPGLRRCNMKYTITPSPDGKYIILKVKGEINRQTSIQPILEAHALAKKLGIWKHLVDVTEVKNTDSILEGYEFAYSDMINTEGIDKNALVAILVSPGDHSHDFIETVLRNAGLHVKIFRDPNAAKLSLTNNGLEERLGKIEEKGKSRKEKPPQIREGDNEAKREEILKQRVACVG